MGAGGVIRSSIEYLVPMGRRVSSIEPPRHYTISDLRYQRNLPGAQTCGRQYHCTIIERPGPRLAHENPQITAQLYPHGMCGGFWRDGGVDTLFLGPPTL